MKISSLAIFNKPGRLSAASASVRRQIAKPLAATLLAASCALFIGASFNLALADDDASSNLSKLEDKFFQHDFSKDEVGERIERLEKLVFGEARSGSNEDRLKSLMALVPNLNAKSDDTQAAAPAAQDSPPGSEPPQSEAKRPARTARPLPDEGGEPVANENSYPAVTAIEKKLLGRDYVGESVSKRLDRLEIKAYGKTSASEDLQDRVDRLKGSTGIDISRNKPPNSEWADEDEDPVMAGSQGVQPFTGIGGGDPLPRAYRGKQQSPYGRSRSSYDPYAGTGTFGAGGGGSSLAGSGGAGRFGDASGLPPPAPDFSRLMGTGQTAPIPAPAMGVSQQISLLEREVFKRTYEKETLLNRLTRLEQTVFPQDKPGTDKSLPERMQRLVQAVPISPATTADATPQQQQKRHRDPDFPDLDFGAPSSLSQQSKGPSGLSKIINGLGSALSGGYTGSYAPNASSGHLVTDPSTGLLYDQYTGSLIDPMTGAIVGKRQVGYPSYGGFNSGMSPMNPYGGMGGMGGMGGGMGSGMGFGFGGGGSGMRLGWP